jgi:hypothetical protein
MSREQTALEIWQEKLEYLYKQEAITNDPGVKFQLKKQIEECQQKIEQIQSYVGKNNLDNDKNTKYSEESNQEKQFYLSAKENHKLSHVFVSLCQQKLACYIGPMANMIVEDTLTEFPNLSSQEFIQTLAREIDNPQESQDFMQFLLLEINQLK